MTRNDKIGGIILLVIIVVTLIVYLYNKKIQKECKKTFTVCLIKNIKKSITSKIYGDFYIRNGKELIVKKDFVLTNIYRENIGKNYITEDGFYFIDYCIDEPGLRTIYTEIFPSDVDSSFLDSSWNNYKEMEFYKYSKGRREEIIHYKDSVKKSIMQPIIH